MRSFREHCPLPDGSWRMSSPNATKLEDSFPQDGHERVDLRSPKNASLTAELSVNVSRVQACSACSSSSSWSNCSCGITTPCCWPWLTSSLSIVIRARRNSWASCCVVPRKVGLYVPMMRFNTPGVNALKRPDPRARRTRANSKATSPLVWEPPLMSPSKAPRK